MQRYFVNLIEDNKVILDKDQIRHIEKVMRMQTGDKITVCYNNEVYLCEIKGFNPLVIETISKIDEDHELKNHVTLLYCLPKGDKLDLVLQKACELGVSEIILVQSERCVAKIKKEDEAKKIARFKTILTEASEQSKRSKIPTLDKIIDYKDIGKYHFDHAYIAYENSTDETFYSSLMNIKDGESIAVLVGSEGGFSPKEVEKAIESGYQSISLGKRILRSETAAIFSLSAISFILERGE
jgi:16S rRNA (uracil1498-N3)-methyltransferase